MEDAQIIELFFARSEDAISELDVAARARWQTARVPCQI